MQRWLYTWIIYMGLGGWMSISQAQPYAFDTTGLGMAIAQAITEQMSEAGVYGTVVTLVQDGRVVLNQGYGEAWAEEQVPVDPIHTLFDIGSVTKLFTAVAVLQQVEHGRLDLDTDVNTYLTAFQVPSIYPEPITLRHLLTHTAGFDDKNIGYVARSATEGQSLGAYLEEALPPRVHAPGTVISYSNHGFGLAGFLVEVVTGQSFADYVTTHIVQPLGMQATTLLAPLPLEQAKQRARGYTYDSRADALIPVPEAHRNLPPAGAVSTTGADMARFMTALLNDGTYEEARILLPESVALLQTTQFSHHPLLPGFTCALMETPIGDTPAFEIRGAFVGTAGAVLLVPEYNVGLFVGANGRRFRPYEAVRRIVENRLPVEAAAPPLLPEPPDDFLARAHRYEGAYHTTRFSRHSVEKIAILDAQLLIQAQAGGTLAVRNRQGHMIDELIEMESLLFRRRSDNAPVVFLENEEGKITHVAQTSGTIPSAFERLSWRDDVRVQLPLMWGLLGVFVSGLVLFPLALGGRRLLWRIRHVATRRRLGYAIPLGVVIQGLLGLVFMIAVSETLGNSFLRQEYVFGLPPALTLVFVLPYLSIGVLLWLGYRIVHAWQQQHGSLPERLYVTAFVVLNLGYAWFLLNWNLFLWP